MKNIKKFDEFVNEEKIYLDVSESRNNEQPIEMIFGDKNTIFQGFDIDGDTERIEFLEQNGGKVKLCQIGFAEEWEEYIDYNNSYAYIEDGKLYVIVYGIPEYISKDAVINYYKKVMEQYLNQEYGEFFETNPGEPICMNVEYNGKSVIV
jgi:hypothetical protein